MRDNEYSIEIMKEQLGNKYICPEIKYAFKNSIQALEKQMPGKVIRKSLYESYKCPDCKSDKYWKEDSYCRKCGKSLSWEGD